MISAFDVYLVMQLDSFILGLEVFTGIIGTGMIAAYLMAAMNRDIYKINSDDHNTAVSIHEWIHKRAWVPIALGILIAITPSSRTAAAMIILPALTSDKVVNVVAPEVKELLGLTKEALRNMAKPEPEKVKAAVKA